MIEPRLDPEIAKRIAVEGSRHHHVMGEEQQATQRRMRNAVPAEVLAVLAARREGDAAQRLLEADHRPLYRHVLPLPLVGEAHEVAAMEEAHFAGVVAADAERGTGVVRNGADAKPARPGRL